MNGYVRVPEKPGANRPEPRPAGVHRLVILVEGSDPMRAPCVVERMIVRGYIAQTRSLLGESPIDPAWPNGAHLRPIGRLSALSDSNEVRPALRAVRSGQAYRITSPSERNLVSPALAAALESLFDQLASSQASTSQAPLPIAFSRGYEAGDRGHGSGLAVDIASIGGRGLREWKQDWDHAVARSKRLPDIEARRAAMAAEVQRNLGYQLYRALLDRGGWRVFNNVVQLFGPWTDRLGPWHRLSFETPTDAQRQMIAEQERIFQAHQDHIHVALG